MTNEYEAEAIGWISFFYFTIIALCLVDHDVVKFLCWVCGFLGSVAFLVLISSMLVCLIEDHPQFGIFTSVLILLLILGIALIYYEDLEAQGKKKQSETKKKVETIETQNSKHIKTLTTKINELVEQHQHMRNEINGLQTQIDENMEEFCEYVRIVDNSRPYRR